MKLGEATKQLKAFVRDIHSKQDQDDKLPKDIFPFFFSREELGTLILWGDDATRYRQCIDAFESTLSKTSVISRKAIESSIQLGILKALDINEKFSSVDFEERLTNAMGEVKKSVSKTPTKWEIVLEISGLCPDGVPLRVGKVDFIVVDEERISDWKGIYKDQFSLESGGKHKKVEAYCSSFDRTIQNKLQGRVCACLEVDAVDSEGARDWAINHLRLTLDAINLFSNVFNSPGTCIGLPGERYPGVSTVSLKFSKDTGGVAYGMNNVGQLVDFSLREAGAKKATDLGFDRIGKLLEKEPRSDLDERLLAGIRWAGRGMIEPRAEEAFLWTTIALETLLLHKDERGSHGFRLGIKCAHLTATTKRARSLVSQKVRKLYNLRNAIVHSGKVEVSDSELHLMRSYCSGVILRLLTTEPFTEMNSEQELEDWFEEQMLGGSEQIDGNGT